MACVKLLIINLILTASVQAIFDFGPGFHHLTVPLPPLPFFGQIKIPILRIPTVQQIKNTIPKPEQLYNGIYVQSSSGFKKDKDGKLVPVGGTYGVTNNNGKVQEYGLPTLHQIKNTIPKPGQLYNGIYVQSSSGFKKDKDGKLVPVGGTYGVTNNNGKVQEYGHFRG